MSDQMKIYFAGSVRGGAPDRELYRIIISKLKKYGFVYNEEIGGEDIHHKEAQRTEEEIFDTDTKDLDDSNVMVAEVTWPSLGVGMELGRALYVGKKTLCLFRPGEGRKLSAMVRGGAVRNPNFVARDYEEKDLDNILKEFFQSE